MARTLRNQAIVDSNHSVTVRAPELIPGASVEVIVVVGAGDEQGAVAGVSFIDAVAGLYIDAPEDYSVKFEDALYRSARLA